MNYLSEIANTLLKKQSTERILLSFFSYTSICCNNCFCSAKTVSIKKTTQTISSSEDKVNIILRIIVYNDIQLYCTCMYIIRLHSKECVDYIKKKYPIEYAKFQYERILTGELVAPEGIKIGDYFINFFQFILINNYLPPSHICFSPGCIRTGKDRNILGVHLRETHPLTYFYIQHLCKTVDVQEINKKKFDIVNKRKRKYEYKNQDSVKKIII